MEVVDILVLNTSAEKHPGSSPGTLTFKVYGPYLRKDGRQHVILIYENGRRRTVSYPKFLVEQRLGRELDPDTETIDHLDTDFNNNNIDNLRILDRKTHAAEDATYLVPTEFECPLCGAHFSLSGLRLHWAKDNRKQGKAGPFCSRRCAGVYGSNVGHGNISKLEVKEIITKKEKRPKTIGNPNTGVHKCLNT